METKQNITELLEQMKITDEPRKQEEARKPQYPKALASRNQSKQKTDQEIKRAYLSGLMGRRR
jgi:hypothetical protein